MNICSECSNASENPIEKTRLNVCVCVGQVAKIQLSAFRTALSIKLKLGKEVKQFSTIHIRIETFVSDFITF